MQQVIVRPLWFVLLMLLFAAMPAAAQIDARMFRQPAVSADKIAFVYAGDIWLVPKSGGAATRLSSPPGEESFPRFSPDAQAVAVCFTAETAKTAEKCTRDLCDLCGLCGSFRSWCVKIWPNAHAVDSFALRAGLSGADRVGASSGSHHRLDERSG